MNSRSSRIRSKFQALQLFNWSFLNEETQRFLARGILAAWLLPILTTLVTALFLSAPQAAHAQSTATSPTVTLVVLDFDVAKGLDPILGRKAADAMAVELKNSGNFEVITRQRVEKVISEQPGLTAPFNAETQVRLAQILGAQGVISGRVISATTLNKRSARCQVEARQLDAATGDIVNGASVNEATLDKLQEIDSDILLDEAINKSAFSLVRTMSQTRLSEGTVLNTTATDVELNLGARNGVVAGQRYSVLRDVLNRSTNVVERLKVAEIQISGVEADQSTAKLVAGGDTGVRTGDKIRLIFVPRAASPVSPAGGSSISLPPAPQAASGPGIVKKASKGLGGILGLGLLVALAGFGGGSSGSRPSSPVTGVVAIPGYVSSTPNITVNYQSGLPGILAGTNIIGYFIYRGTEPNFPINAGTLEDFVPDDTRIFSDRSYGTAIIRREVQIDAAGSSGGNNSSNNSNGASGPPVVTINNSGPFDPDEPGSSFTTSSTSINAFFLKTPPVPGVQYYYKIVRVTASAPPGEIGGNNNGSNNSGNNSGNNNNNNGNSDDRLLPVLSQPSESSGGATPLVRPTITRTSGNLDDFNITVRVAQLADFNNPLGGIEQADQVVVQVLPDGKVNSRFERVFPIPGNLTVADTNNPPAGLAPGVSPISQDGTFVISLGDIVLQNYTPGDPITVRVGLRNSTDSPGFVADSLTQENFTFSTNFQVGAPTGTSIVGSRSVATSGIGRRSGGLGLPGSTAGDATRGGARRTPGYILRPR